MSGHLTLGHSDNFLHLLHRGHPFGNSEVTTPYWQSSAVRAGHLNCGHGGLSLHLEHPGQPFGKVVGVLP